MEVFCDVRLASNAQSKVLAHASVTLALGTEGQVVIDGFSVLDNGKGAWVAPPARKGDRRYFPVVTLAGKVRADVERAILARFEEQRGEESS
jgi:DNA-binding cell septation regulator SpoVG